MKRALITVSFILVFVIVSSNLTPSAYAQQKKKPKNVILSTVDIKEDYEILGIAWVRSADVNLATLNEKLKEEGKKSGADYIITIRYFDYLGYIYAYGTAVKIKEKKAEEPKP